MSSFNECASSMDISFTPIELMEDNTLFNHPPPGIVEALTTDIIDIIMLVKHVLYRLKFRTNLQILPTTRLVTITAAMDLEKAISVRSYLNKGAVVMTMFLDKLKIGLVFEYTLY
jgi:hypothetical protein